MTGRRPDPTSLYDRLDDVLLRAERPTLLVPASTADPSTVALLSGSFDPITIGHAALADAAADRADLVLLVYSIRTLPKARHGPAPLLSERDRLRVLEAFARNRERAVPALASHGLLAEQAEAARRRFPAAGVFLVMGSDKALQVLDPNWYADRDSVLTRMFAYARVLYANRSGEEGSVAEVLARAENVRWRSSFERLEVPPDVASVSSREVRERLYRGEDVGALVPPEVLPFVPKTR
jgi:nicotinamide-nucleotide adenylyltransferase